MESDFFSLPALSRAVETRDSAAMRGFYAEDARLRIIDRDHPPSRPQEIVGRSAIAAYFEDVCGRTMTHELENGCLDGKHLAYTQACAYPDGTRVFCAAMAELKDGKIANQTIVQAWDA
ncbi:MAG: nuclear transport factor 2 family protein [Rhodomicrobium sp.]